MSGFVYALATSIDSFCSNADGAAILHKYSSKLARDSSKMANSL